MKRALLVVLPVTGCLYADNARIQRARELCHPVYGCQEMPWWPDTDGDGFGDPDAAPVLAIDRPDLAANNDLDCDDTDPALTARVKTLCPAEFLQTLQPGDARVDRGLESLIGRSPARALDAWSVCGPVGWGGRLGATSPELVWTNEPAWVALDPAQLAGWEDVPGFDGLPADFPVALVEGRLVSGSFTEERPFFCSREAPSPGDWYTVGP